MPAGLTSRWLLLVALLPASVLGGCGGPPPVGGRPHEESDVGEPWSDLWTEGLSALEGYIDITRPGTGVADGYLYVPKGNAYLYVPRAGDNGDGALFRDQQPPRTNSSHSGKGLRPHYPYLRQAEAELPPIISGDPVPPEGYESQGGARVEIPSLGLSTVTAASGYFVFYGVPLGTVGAPLGMVPVTAYPTGYDPITVNLEVEEGVLLILPTSSAPDGMIPAAGATIDIRTLNVHITADSDGHYRIDTVPPGTYDLEIRVPGYPDRVWTMPVTVRPGTAVLLGIPADVEFTLD